MLQLPFALQLFVLIVSGWVNRVLSEYSIAHIRDDDGTRRGLRRPVRKFGREFPSIDQERASSC
jgi:hypothetical protein